MKKFGIAFLIALLLTVIIVTGLAENQFVIDVSAMPAPAREAWERLFLQTYGYAIRGNPNEDLPSLPNNKGKISGFFPEDTVFRITGKEPVEFWINEKKIFSTEMKNQKGYAVVGYFIVPVEEWCTIVNSNRAYETGIYPVLDLRGYRYYYDEYRLLAGYLLLPVEENNEEPYLAIDVIFQGKEGVPHHGVITLDKNNQRRLVMTPPDK